MKYQLLICFVCLNLASCAITGKKHHYTGTKHNNKGAVRIVKLDNIQLENSGIIYGNIQTHSQLKNLEINKLLENGKVDSKSEVRVRTFSNGNFVAENLLPGSYIISSVETKSNLFGLYDKGAEVEFYSIQVYDGEAVYAGTYTITTSKNNNSDESNKTIVFRSAVPNEKKILKHISKIEHNTIWSNSLRIRMRKLI